MSDDAFALTPVAAQPPPPSEAVYQALNAALSATARGRWFLSEFAKRNRNSESSKMLDAVARIEQAVADRPTLTPASADLVIARGWAQAARLETLRLLKAPEHEAAHTAAQRGTRIIREIAIQMRAVGNDARICDILDKQLDAIDAAQSAADAESKSVIAAFDRLLAQIDELIPAPPPPPVQEPQIKLLATADPEARLAAVTDLAVACAIGDPNVAPTAAQIAEDDDLLARIALEMGSPDDEPETAAVPVAPPVTDVMAAEAASDQHVAENNGVSLGQSLLAQGLVPSPPKALSDPFVALKRLTQSEKVALFT